MCGIVPTSNDDVPHRAGKHTYTSTPQPGRPISIRDYFVRNLGQPPDHYQPKLTGLLDHLNHLDRMMIWRGTVLMVGLFKKISKRVQIPGCHWFLMQQSEYGILVWRVPHRDRGSGEAADRTVIPRRAPSPPPPPSRGPGAR